MVTKSPGSAISDARAAMSGTFLIASRSAAARSWLTKCEIGT